MDTGDIRTPAREFSEEKLNDGKDAHRDNAAHNDQETQERLRHLQNAMPFYHAEKFHFSASASGFIKLRPNPEFLSAIEADAPKFADYGYELNHADGKLSTEGELAVQLVEELTPVLETVKALDDGDREINALKKFISDRATNNCVYAAINQFEIDGWVARAAKNGKDPSEDPAYNDKQSRRDGMATVGAVWCEVHQNLFNEAISENAFVKAAKSTVYLRADILGRELLNPKDEARQQTAEVAGAIAAARPF